MTDIPIINIEKCRGCGLCVAVCKLGVIILFDNKATIIGAKECDWCTICETVCPNGAISCPFVITQEKNTNYED